MSILKLIDINHIEMNIENNLMRKTLQFCHTTVKKELLLKPKKKKKEKKRKKIDRYNVLSTNLTKRSTLNLPQ